MSTPAFLSTHTLRVARFTQICSLRHHSTVQRKIESGETVAEAEAAAEARRHEGTEPQRKRHRGTKGA